MFSKLLKIYPFKKYFCHKKWHIKSNFLDSDNSSYFDKKNIETTFNIGDYNLHIDYNDNIFIELNKTEENSQTLTFW